MAFPNRRFRLGAIVPLAGLSFFWPVPTIAQTSPASQPTALYDEPFAVCEIKDPRLDEASGLVASRRNRGYYYTHNDSGGQPDVYVLDRTGRICTTIRLAGAQNVDWEDISLAPGDKPNTYDVCVGDIGDNRARRSEIVIYRFPEPEIGAEARADGTIDLTPKAFRCKYEDGPRNAEALAVDPTGVAWVFTKNYDGSCHVYRLAPPWDDERVNTLRRIGSLKFPTSAPPMTRIVTAADISPDGTRLVTRSYLGGWEFRLPERATPGKFADIFAQTPVALTLPLEPQGEALCFSADGDALLTISEKTPTTLYEVPASKRAPPNKP